MEAGLHQGWDAWLQPDDGFIGMTGFGASAPIKDLYPHFKITAEAVVENKADMGIARLYSDLSGELHEQFWPVIQAEFELTMDLLLKHSNHETLLEGDYTLQRAIMLRNPYVDPMSILQVELLSRWREGDRQDDALFDVLLASVNGIAQGLQNTG